MPKTAKRKLEKKPGRPRRTVVDVLRVMLWFFAVALRLMMPAKGYAFEYRFDGYRYSSDRKRPCKYDRYRRGERTPAAETRRKVDVEYPGASEWLELLLWKLLADDDPESDVPWNTITQVIGPVIDATTQEDIERTLVALRKQPSNPRILEIIARKSDINALTCLIGLFLYAKRKGNVVAAWEIEFYIRDVFLRLMALLPYRFIATRFLDFLINDVLVIDHPRIGKNPWFVPLDELDDHLALRHQLVLTMEDLGLIGLTQADHLEMQYWFDKGNSAEIGRDIERLLQTHNWKIDDPSKGLGWLIAKIQVRPTFL